MISDIMDLYELPHTRLPPPTPGVDLEKGEKGQMPGVGNGAVSTNNQQIESSMSTMPALSRNTFTKISGGTTIGFAILYDFHYGREIMKDRRFCTG